MESLKKRTDGSGDFGQTVLRETGGAWAKLEISTSPIGVGVGKADKGCHTLFFPWMEVVVVSLLCPQVGSPACSIRAEPGVARGSVFVIARAV